jgi:8-oxo-dGTP diphosphatase
MNNTIHVVARALILHNDELLLAYDLRPEPRHYYELNVPFYYLPGGHIEFKESAENAVLREIYEETGYDATIERFLEILEHSWECLGDAVYCHTHEINHIDLRPSNLKNILPQWLTCNNINILQSTLK